MAPLWVGYASRTSPHNKGLECGCEGQVGGDGDLAKLEISKATSDLWEPGCPLDEAAKALMRMCKGQPQAAEGRLSPQTGLYDQSLGSPSVTGPLKALRCPQAQL